MPSTVIQTFDYDAEGRRLDITFVTGKRYSYADVPPEVAADMRRAFSKGWFFNRFVRDRYPAIRQA